MSASTIRDKIREAEDRGETTLSIPEWDVDLLLISPATIERTEMILRFTHVALDDEGVPIVDEDGTEKETLDLVSMMPSLVAACTHDPETRERVFATDADVAMLNTKNGAIVERIAFACMPLAGLGGKDGPVPLASDDSSTTPNGGSESASPLISAVPTTS